MTTLPRAPTDDNTSVIIVGVVLGALVLIAIIIIIILVVKLARLTNAEKGIDNQALEMK